MNRAITLRVITDQGLAIQDEAVSIIAPGEPGYVGFLYNHAPLVTTLGKGKFTWCRADGTQQTVRLSGGLLEIVHNRLTVLTSTVADLAASPAHASS